MSHPGAPDSVLKRITGEADSLGQEWKKQSKVLLQVLCGSPSDPVQRLGLLWKVYPMFRTYKEIFL